MNVKRLEWKKLHRNRILVATGASFRYAISSKLIFDENDNPATVYSVVVVGMQSAFDDHTIDNAVPNHSTLESAIVEANALNRKEVLDWILPERESSGMQWTNYDKTNDSWSSGDYIVKISTTDPDWGFAAYYGIGMRLLDHGFTTAEEAMDYCHEHSEGNCR